MKQTKDKEYYLRRAKVGIKTLAIYFDVTRPQYEKQYHEDGKFSVDKMLKQIDFINRHKGSYMAKSDLELYKRYSTTFNYTFGIPSKLIDEVLGRYRENGKMFMVKREEVLGSLEEEGWIEVLHAGSKVGKKDGKYAKLFWWSTKLKIKNREYWFKLLSDSRYSDYTKYPLDDEGFVERAVKIIAAWRKKNVGEKETKKSEPPKQEKSVIPTTNYERLWNALPSLSKSGIIDLIHEFETGRLEFGGLQRGLSHFNIPSELNDILEKRAYQRKIDWNKKLQKQEGNKQ